MHAGQASARTCPRCSQRAIIEGSCPLAQHRLFMIGSTSQLDSTCPLLEVWLRFFSRLRHHMLGISSAVHIFIPAQLAAVHAACKHIRTLPLTGSIRGSNNGSHACCSVCDCKDSFHTAPTCSAGRQASLVPFALRWLQADLPERLGSPAESQELQYALLHRCQQEATSDADLAATARR